MKEELLLGFGVWLKHSKISAFRIHGDADGSVDVCQFFQADSFKHCSRIWMATNLHTALWRISESKTEEFS